MWSLTLGRDIKQQALKGQMLRKVLGPRKGEISGKFNIRFQVLLAVSVRLMGCNTV
jgi:hypothetical protein